MNMKVYLNFLLIMLMKKTNLLKKHEQKVDFFSHNKLKLNLEPRS